MMMLLRNLLEAVAILNPETLNLNLTESLEPISLLADFEFPFNVTRNLAENILDQNSISSNFDQNLIFQFKTFKNLLCGFPPNIIEALFRFFF